MFLGAEICEMIGGLKKTSEKRVRFEVMPIAIMNRVALINSSLFSGRKRAA